MLTDGPRLNNYPSVQGKAEGKARWRWRWCDAARSPIVSLLSLSCVFGLRPDTQRDGVHTRGFLYITHALERCGIIGMISWESCTMLTKKKSILLMWSRKSRQNMHMPQIGTGGIVEKRVRPGQYRNRVVYRNRVAFGGTRAEPSGRREDYYGAGRRRGLISEA